jgi:ubiquitin carboxyl-terminal hydrolase 7
MIEQMKLRQTFVTSEIQDGDVICFQAEISDKESVFQLIHESTLHAHLVQLNRQQEFEAHQLYSQVPQFYDFLQNRVLVSFKPKFEEVSELNPEFELILSKKNTYDVVSISESRMIYGI